ncbi:hypothetical protein AUJ17_03200 [Candidatus Micrarchaeota archaeon CG1_02_47_40]|nr:MAG: hypothetical protein AUJ17_03200 [Candidatus Micrarchaeota archaeon CG1_02_47_40]
MLLKILVFGNPLVKEDSLPLRVMGKLQGKFPKIEFVLLDAAENIPEKEDLIILDTVFGIKTVKMIEELEIFVQNKKLTMHDCDLGFQLLVMKKMGLLGKVKIIGVPPEYGEEKARNAVERAIRKLCK